MIQVSQERATIKAGSPAFIARLIDRIITVAATSVAVLALVLLFLSLGAEVVVRYLTTQGLGWPSEMPNLLFPWLVMGGVVLAAQHGAHISVTLILDLLGPARARILLLVMQIVIAGTFFYLAYIGLAVIEITGTEVYPVTGVAARWAYMALIAGFFGIGLTALTTFIQVLVAEDPLSVRAHNAEEEL
jgi:TRAP-type C4-dicarboxylate transport system permease small subunit